MIHGDVCSSSTTTSLPGVGTSPTPKAKAPLSTCPSTADTTRQLTVYTPLGSGRDGVTWSCSFSPGTIAGAETPGTVAPCESRTRTSESWASGSSENVSTMCRGDDGTEDPAAGAELSSAECAPAGAASAARQPAATAATSAARRSTCHNAARLIR